MSDEEFSFRPAKRTAGQKERDALGKTAQGSEDPGTSPPSAQALFPAAFSAKLAEIDPVWAELLAEKKAGWDSPAVGLFWEKRSKMHEKSKGSSNATRPGFLPTTGKYLAFYSKTMPQLSRELFARAAGGEERPPQFVDLGSAPGGMCEYLCGDLGWTGHALSLAPADGGFPMAFEHSALRYHDCDMGREAAWCEALGHLGPAAAGSCRFVNAGIVVDKGQATLFEAGLDEGERARHKDDLAVRLYVNQLLTALTVLERGGALYFAYQPRASDYSMLFRLLLLLRPCFARVRVTGTFDPSRTPIYCYLDGFSAEEGPARACAQALEAGELPVFDAVDWGRGVLGLYGELRGDLQAIWGLQKNLLRRSREDKEQKHAAKSGGR